ncbi:hypothetical protein LLH00_18320 [bacterium]|nr:hypothetical protein [bacterium]
MRVRNMITLLCLALLYAACGKKPQPSAAPAPQAEAVQAEPDSAVAEAPPADTVTVPKRKTIRDYKSALTERDWQNALDSIPTLSLQTADSLGRPFIPPAVLHWLIREGYSIPQYSMWEVFPSNYFDAHLFDPAVTDWVVLASKDHVSRILIFRGCNPEDTLSLYPAPDRDYLEYLGEGKFGYYRQVEHYSPERILSDARRFGAPDTTFKIEHDGLDVRYAIPGGGGLYFADGEWLHLPGEFYKPPTIPTDIWEAVAREVPGHPASAFARLPKGIAEWIDSHGYTIPLPEQWLVLEPNDQYNILCGEFSRPGQKDWIVLVLKDEVSSIAFFPAGDTTGTELFGSGKNMDFLAYMTDGLTDILAGFSRILEIVKPEELNVYQGIIHPELLHAAVFSGGIESYHCYSVYYREEGVWKALNCPD